MNRKEKTKYRLLCGFFAVISLFALVRSELKVGDLNRTAERERILAEQELYESASECKAALEAYEKERMARAYEGEVLTAPSPAVAVRLLRASVLGKHSTSRLSIEEEKTEGLNLFFSAVAECARGQLDPTLTLYAVSLCEYLSQRRTEAATAWDGLPQYTVEEMPSIGIVPEQGIVDEADARDVAEKALGGNLSLRQATRIDESGYLYVLSNAYVRVGKSGRVREMSRDLGGALTGASNLTEKDAETAAKQVLADCGYDRGAFDIVSCVLDGDFYTLCASEGEMLIEIGISAKSGSWSFLRTSNRGIV